MIQAIKNVQIVASCNFGGSRIGKTVTVSVLDNTGSVLGSGYTAGAVFELSDGQYAVAITFTTAFTGILKWSNTTDGLELYEPLLCVNDWRDDLTAIKRVSLNRWKIVSNQLIIYADDATTPLYTFDLKAAGVANGTSPDERVPA